MKREDKKIRFLNMDIEKLDWVLYKGGMDQSMVRKSTGDTKHNGIDIDMIEAGYWLEIDNIYVDADGNRSDFDIIYAGTFSGNITVETLEKYFIKTLDVNKVVEVLIPYKCYSMVVYDDVEKVIEFVYLSTKGECDIYSGGDVYTELRELNIMFIQSDGVTYGTLSSVTPEYHKILSITEIENEEAVKFAKMLTI